MNRNIATRVQETASLKNTVLLGLLFLFVAFFILPEATKQILQYGEETNLINGKFYFSSAQIYQMLSEYGDKGRSLYLIVELTADLFFSIVSALFLGTLLIWSAFRSRNHRIKIKYLLCFPILLLLISMLENGVIVWLLYHYPLQYTLLAFTTSFLALFKWALALSCVVLASWNLLLLLFQKSGTTPA